MCFVLRTCSLNVYSQLRHLYFTCSCCCATFKFNNQVKLTRHQLFDHVTTARAMIFNGHPRRVMQTNTHRCRKKTTFMLISLGISETICARLTRRYVLRRRSSGWCLVPAGSVRGTPLVARDLRPNRHFLEHVTSEDV